jgi:RimJ/RimL family protein N-acetyltransferase
MEKSIVPASVKSLPPVTLRPVDSPELFRLVAGWLNEPENARWLDFGDGRQSVSPEWLKVGTQRGTMVLRIFDSDAGTPAGVAGFDRINRHFRSAGIFVVVGDKACLRRGYATRATTAMLTFGFADLGLHSIHTWVVEHNPSVHVARNVGFKPVGRQRECHFIDGRPYDRLWFDILGSEHKEL